VSENGVVTAPEGTAAESGRLLAHGVATCMILGEEG
jgi:hypothetical protein